MSNATQMEMTLVCPTCQQPLADDAEVPMNMRLRAMRLARGLTISGLASRIGCTHAYISMVERGVKQISLQSFVAVARALNVTLDELAGFDSDREGEGER